jgi:hypothetical protein
MWFDSLIVSEKICIKPKHAPLKVTISKKNMKKNNKNKQEKKAIYINSLQEKNVI